MLFTLGYACLALAMSVQASQLDPRRMGFTTLPPTTKTKSKCFTQRAPTGSTEFLPTTKITKPTRTELVFVVTTSIPKVTVTPSAVTKTTTTTVTSTATTTLVQNTTMITTQSTNVFSVIITPTAFTTQTITDTTTTTTTSVSVIPTPSGFLPIDQTLNISPQQRRDLSKASKSLNPRHSKGGISRANWRHWVPIGVKCHVKETVIHTEEIIFYKPTSTVKASAPTSIVTSTVTTTITSTVVPPVATVVATAVTSITTTITASALTTSATTTTTDTVTVSTSTTSYAACGTNNVLPDSANYAWTTDDAGSTSSTDADSGYDCCVACMQDPECINAVYDQYLQPTCTLFGGVSASCGTQSGGAVANASSQGYEPDGLSNGPCNGWYPYTGSS